MQLIYRWTKSLDPSLKKGLWAPEEDAVSLLLGGRAEPSSDVSSSGDRAGVVGTVAAHRLIAGSPSFPAEVAPSSCQVRGAGLV